MVVAAYTVKIFVDPTVGPDIRKVKVGVSGKTYVGRTLAIKDGQTGDHEVNSKQCKNLFNKNEQVSPTSI